MKNQSEKIKSRIQLYNLILKPNKNTKLAKAGAKIEADKEGKSISLEEFKKENVSKTQLAQIEKIDAFADLVDNNESLTTCLFEKSKELEFDTVRDLALKYDADKLSNLFHANQIPKDFPGETQKEKEKAFAFNLEKRIFQKEPSASIRRLIKNRNIKVEDKNLQSGITSFFEKNPDFNIKKESILQMLSKEDALSDIKKEDRTKVKTQLKTLQRITAISPNSKTLEVLYNKNLHSASQISQMSESNFMRRYGEEIGQDEARQTYHNAVAARIRNEQAMMTINQAVKPTGIDMIDSSIIPIQMGEIIFLQGEEPVALSYETLFGTADFCECGHCNSIYSPSAYFVELLQYLRNNNLDPENTHTGQSGYIGTPLEHLFWRRPDLKCLQLTCENAFTILPYIDLSNEIMECYVAHNDNKASANPSKAIQVDIETFNTYEDDESSTLLAQPQNIHKKAYCTLSKAVYPFCLPYHQPIDGIRIFLDHLKMSRYDLMKSFRPFADGQAIIGEALTDIDSWSTQASSMADEEHMRIDRALCSEYLKMTEEEHVIITKEGFATKSWYEVKDGSTITDDDYNSRIRLKPLHDYYFHPDDSKTVSELENVKDEFLPRTGLSYIQLVDLLKTFYINPYQPLGEVKNILDKLSLNYKFMQTYVDYEATSVEDKYKKLLAFIHYWHRALQIYYIEHPDPCTGEYRDLECLNKCDIEKWVYYYFEKIGKLIVLESDNDFRFKYPGILKRNNEQGQKFKVNDRGEILGENWSVIGQINQDLSVSWNMPIRGNEDFVLLVNEKVVGKIKYLKVEKENFWYLGFDDDYRDISAFEYIDSCDINKIKLTHLDGTALDESDWDKIHRFIRLWKKLEWSMAELDQAVLGLNGTTEIVEENIEIEACLEKIKDKDKDDCSCSKLSLPIYQHGMIDGALICKLAKLLQAKETVNISLPVLLAFWSDIEVRGKKSLYRKLFLKKNLLALDPIFKSDGNGNYLQNSDVKISEHIPGIMAGLNVKADDITLLNDSLGLDDEMILSNISSIYRHQILSRSLRISIKELLSAIELFGNPFLSIQACCDFIECWNMMKASGLKLRELLFVILDQDYPESPIKLSFKEQLILSLEIYDGLKNIDAEHSDITEESFTLDLFRSKLAHIYDPDVMDKIVALVEGVTVYSTNVSAGLTIAVDSDITTKVQYVDNGVNSKVIITGILTQVEKDHYYTLTSDPEWSLALDRINSQIQLFFEDTFYALITDPAERDMLLSGDDIDANSNIDKALLILDNFMPYLRTVLKDQLVVNVVSSNIPLDNLSTENLLRNVLVDELDDSVSLLDSFKSIGINIGTITPGSFEGYLIPQKTDNYTFVVQSETGGVPGTILLNGNLVQLAPLPDPTNVFYSTESYELIKGEVHEILLSGFDPDFELLKWKTVLQPAKKISDSILVPNHLTNNFESNFKKVQKTSLVIDAYSLSLDAKNYLQKQALDQDFDQLNFNSITFDGWKRLHQVAWTRDELPLQETSLFDFFNWAKYSTTVNEEEEIIAELAKLTNWGELEIEQYIQRNHFNILSKSDLINESNLIKLIKAHDVKEKVNVSIDKLFEWAQPRSEFDYSWNVSSDIQNVLKSKYPLDDWEEVVKPLNDKLRTNQRDALIQYLLNQKALQDWGVIDADSLFEFFLIDVQMESCMETSRIKQAISSTQLFVQRCFLNLESYKNLLGGEMGVANTELDRDRWNWMSRYRVWEANRKVFCYPENWIRTELRDDKSSFYKELESELLQKDINPEMVKDALKSYLYKLDEVADMKVEGIYVVKNSNGEIERLHIVSRTRSAPYFFHYRLFENGNWYPWELLDFEIPIHEFVQDGKTISNGTYVIPLEWKGRIFILFPQFLAKTSPSKVGNPTYEEMAERSPSDKKPEEYWEIKLNFSERISDKWSQNKVSESSLARGVYRDYFQISNYITYAEFQHFNEINKYKFQITYNIDSINIYTHHNNYNPNFEQPFDYFLFDGSTISVKMHPTSSVSSTTYDNFNYEISSNQHYAVNEPSIYFNNATQRLQSTSSLLFKHDFSKNLLESITVKDLKTFFNHVNINRDSPNLRKDDFGDYIDDLNQSIFHELKKVYSLYNWEIFFHIPMAIAENLCKNQQFEEAMNWYHFVFNPFESGSNATRFWRFLPFRHTNGQNYLESFFKLLQPNQSNDAITEWRNNPFNPHLIARSRPSAYMKWTLMKYLDNILEWGDYLFRQDTMESVNYATQLYVLAGHILGKKPQQIPKRGKIKPKSYLHLMDKLDAFSNASTELELIFPFSNQVNIPYTYNGEEASIANIFGLAQTQYFCFPNNPKLMSYWDTFSDRLYKIRHCLNIDGIFRKLSLFEPPIDPGLLVTATAQGLSLSSILNDLNAPVPNYRFNYMLQKSFELCSEVKSLGNTLLSSLEKRDGEELSLMRSKHEVSMNNLVMEVRKKQLEEAKKSLDSLFENRKSPVYRMQYFLRQVGEDLSKIPNESSEFQELFEYLELPLNESSLKLISFEKEELDKANAAKKLQKNSSILSKLSSVLRKIPDIEIKAQPFGIGIGTSVGGTLLGNITSEIAWFKQLQSTEKSSESSLASRKGGFKRQLQDRIQQANIAGREIKQIDKQIVTQKIRIQMAEQEIENHQQQIDNSKEVEEYLKTKYTNEQLYSWMKGQVKTLFYQSYKMAYDLAKKVEGLYRFERGLTSTNFIHFGYWNSARDGLLSGEQLYNGLKQIEIAHQETRAHDYEIPNKQISLRKLDPNALLAFRKDGACNFSIPEELYDMDFPGHFKRRIKSVSFSIPCIAGPYTNISAKATLTEHSFRVSKLATDPYSRKLGEDDQRFMTVNVPINAIALSSAQNDGGLFELNFRDERYMPFEGAGAISKWNLELPGQRDDAGNIKGVRQFDYNTISDVIIHMSYTSCEGGNQLKELATSSLEDAFSNIEHYPQYALFDLKHDFAQEWYKAMSEDDGSGQFIMTVNDLKSRLPYFVANHSFFNGSDPLEPDEIKIISDSGEEISDSVDINISGSDDLVITFNNVHEERLWLWFSYKLD